MISSSPAAGRRANTLEPADGTCITPWWIGVTTAAAVTATLFDAVLLQYRRSYFTGGFLASDFVTTPSQAVAFLTGSLLADAAGIAVVVWAALWVFGRLAMRRSLALAVTFVLALTPIVIADFIEYQLVTYLGDAFDLGLLFELSGRSVGEILAVSSAQIGRAAWMTAAGLAAAILLLWMASRRIRFPARTLGGVRLWPGVIVPFALFAVGALAITALRSRSDVLDNGLRRKPTGRLLGAIVEKASDIDRDGYGVLGRPDDPRLFDERVRPYAVDVPGNGIDEDGVGGDLPSSIEPYREEKPSGTWLHKPDIVLIVLESFRADVRGAHLRGKAVTPVLDSLAATGIAPRHAYSHNGYTVQSRRHIFTGSTADIRGNDTLIDDFKRQGYEVAYFSGQDESFGGPRHGIGFDRADIAYDARVDRERRYSEFTTAGSLAVSHAIVGERVAAFLQGRRGDKPLFLYVNFHDTHFPYHHRDIQPLLNAPIIQRSNIAPARAQDVREMYMNTAANVDRAIGEVLSHARRTLGHEPGVIVLSDHGESLFDEGFLGHGYSLNDAQTKIPLVISGLPLSIQEPFAQGDLRDAIATALTRSDAADQKPTITRTASRTVFQYLGLITRPVQIALTDLNGRMIYDFREGRARIGGDEWRRPEDLNPEQRSAYLRLIQTWERMMIARKTVNSTD